MGKLERNTPQELSRRGLGGRLRSVLGRREVSPSVLSISNVIVPAGEVVQGEVVDNTKQLIERPRTARLPKEFLETDTLAQLKEGRSAWTVPWAMAVTQEGECYLNGGYTFRNDPGGTVQMLVERTKDGYEVEVPSGYKYQPSKTNPWVGAADEDLLPVKKVKKGRTSY